MSQIKLSTALIFNGLVIIALFAFWALQPASEPVKITLAQTYVSPTGERLEAFYRADDSVQVQFNDQVFIAKQSRSASGAQYQDHSSGYVFWSKGQKASLYDADSQAMFQGVELTPNQTQALESDSRADQGVESLRFSESKGYWLDDFGQCHTCTPENGFGSTGEVDNIAWRELKLRLLNDLGEAPEVDEVKALFRDYYADGSGRYPVYVERDKGVFTVLLALPIELKDMDFTDRTGTLVATYEVLQP